VDAVTVGEIVHLSNALRAINVQVVALALDTEGHLHIEDRLIVDILLPQCWSYNEEEAT